MKQWKVILLWLYVLSIGISGLDAQVAYNVDVYANTGNPGGLNTESDIATSGWNTIMTGGIMTNQWSAPASLPFGFQFFGNNVSSFRVSANGLLTFTANPNSPPNDNQALPSSLLPDKTIACFWEAFTHDPPVSFSDLVDTKVFGTAPNRQFWVRWYSFEWGPINFAYLAVVFEETTNKIYVVDMYESLNSNLVTATVGVQSTTSFAIQSGSSSTPLANGGSGNLDNSYHAFTPFEIQAYDVGPVAITSPTGTGCGLGQEAVNIKISNVGLFNATGATARMIVDGGPPSAPETIPQTITPNDTIDFTFSTLANLSALGPHTITVVVTVPSDGDRSNDSLSMTLTNLMEISTFPHKEDFENGAAGWLTKGINSSWALGPPFNNSIKGSASGVNAWVTNLSGNYNDNEQSSVESPCFDLSTLGQGAVVSIKLWWETENDWDGAVLQASITGGSSWANIGSFGAPINWFNDYDIHAGPGGQQSGWSGSAQNKGSKGWIKSQHPLPPSLIGNSNVHFRIAFASDNSQNTDGVAFDDFAIGVPPQVNLGTDRFFCEGETLDAANPGKTILWSTGATSQTISLTNPTGNTFQDSIIVVSVTDNIGLIGKDTILVSMTVPVDLQVDAVEHVACYGDSTGSIMVTPTGGMAPYYYLWSNGSNFEDQPGLPAGTYTVTTTDANDCITIPDPITLTENPLLVISDSLTHVGCEGGPTGKIELQVSGGMGGYRYSWNTGDSTAILQNLPAGEYQVEVADMLGCADTLFFAVAQPDTFPEAGFTFDFAGSAVGFKDTSRGAETFFWDFGDEAGTSTKANPGYFYTQNGVFEVMQIITNLCGSDTSIQTVNITQVDMEDPLDDPAIGVYPNPNTGSFEIVFNRVVPDDYILKIFNPEGKLLYYRPIRLLQTGSKQSVRLYPVPPSGIYFLRLESAKTIHYSKIVIE